VTPRGLVVLDVVEGMPHAELVRLTGVDLLEQR
jgi:hypothetical protein